jgi:hypothetical protein
MVGHQPAWLCQLRQHIGNQWPVNVSVRVMADEEQAQ